MNLSEIYENHFIPNLPNKVIIKHKEVPLLQVLEGRSESEEEYYTSYVDYPNAGSWKVADLNGWEFVEIRKEKENEI